MDAQLQQTIKTLEEQFNSCLTSGPGQLEAFTNAWTTFLQSLSEKTSKASSATMNRIDKFAAYVANVASVRLEYGDTEHRICEEISQGIASKLSGPSSCKFSLLLYRM